MFKKIKENKGFTLAELLVVVAIIGVLVAISIPIFTSQLEKSREAVDLANIRAAYAQVASAAITDDKADIAATDGGVAITYDSSAKTYSADVDIKQATAKWITANPECAGKDLSSIEVASGDKVTVTVGVDGTLNIAKK